MPRYSYECCKCKKIFNIVHSITKKLSICKECEGELIRLPSSFSTVKKGVASSDKKTGDVVKQKIEQFKEDLEKEKDKLKKVEYK